MEALGIDWRILIGQIINFFILFYLLKRFALKPFLKLLDNRKKKIEEGLQKSEEAEKILGRLKEMQVSLQEKGEKDAKELVLEAEKRAEKRMEEILVLAQKEKEKIVEQGRILCAREMVEAEKGKDKEVIEKAVALAEKFLKEKITAEKDKKFIEEIVSGLN